MNAECGDSSQKIKNIAEKTAYDFLSKIFPDTRKIPEQHKSKTPDFDLGNNIHVEVYCPDESHQNREDVKAELDHQSGMVRIAISHPVTGSDGLALQFPTNKVIDRILNKKWEHDQFDSTKCNLLWLDLKNSLGLSVHDCGPLKSINHGGCTYVGMFGVWHSFYGIKGGTIFRDRSVIRFLDTFSSYEQSRQGFFRDRQHIVAAMILCNDGLLLFENPWAESPIEKFLMKKLMLLDQFRPELSYFSPNKSTNLLAQEVGLILSKISSLSGDSAMGEI